MEYMGAPESARLLGRSPEYWLEHMGRDRAVAAALRLHHDASLIMTNVQVMSQFVTSLNRTAYEVMRMVYDILHLRSIVIFDNFIVLVARFFLVLSYKFNITLLGSLLCGGPSYSTQGIPWKCH